MRPVDLDTDRLIRLAAFHRLEELRRTYGDVLPRRELGTFDFNGKPIALMSQQGIMKPSGMAMALSITTSPDNPYGDEVSADGFIVYHYQGSDPARYDNAAVTLAGSHGAPLVYFHGIAPGQYLAFWPAFVQHNDLDSLTWRVAIDEPEVLRPDLTSEVVDEVHRRYTTQLARKRLHQMMFRQRVLTAYRSSCTLCRIRHPELLDAAHIIGDREAHGVPAVSNGLALCKIHHAAFDANIVGVRPDYVVEVRADVLTEHDGPMLRYGIQELHGSGLLLPRRPIDRPQRALLEERYSEFRQAG